MFTLAVVAIVWVIPRSMFLSSLVEHTCPGLIPASSYARNLNSGNRDLICNSLAHLRRRKNPVAVTQALQLLQSTNDYIWLNAALYTGACGKPEAVPYLIKGLRHTAWRADADIVEYLRELTNQNLGTEFQRWQQWWQDQHRNSSIDWTSHLGSSPRLSGDEKK